MSDEIGRPAVPAWFWIVAVAALLWEAMGCYAYLTQISMDAGDLAKQPAAQADLWRTMPIWVKCAYAIAVWVGLSGAIGLLLRRRWARETFALSMLAVIVQFGWVYLATPALSALGAGNAAFPALIVVAAILLFWFASYSARRLWLR
jgi:hypothetical protein